jgi:hypothetical protein
MDPLPDHPRLSLFDPQLLWATFALVATLLLGAVVFAWLDRWRKRPAHVGTSPGELLAEFRSSYDRGEMSQEEYERVRAKLAPKLRQQLDLPVAGAQASRPKAESSRQNGSPPAAEEPPGGSPSPPPAGPAA